MCAAPLSCPDDNTMLIKALGYGSEYHKGTIKSVELLGYGKVKFIRTPDGLTVTLPSDAPHSIAPVLRIKK